MKANWKAKRKALTALAFVTAATASHAAIDAAVTTAIGDAKTDMLALLATLTGAGVAIWVARLIYNHFRVK